MNDSSGARLQSLFDAALQSYETQTGFKLIDHPLAKQLENCHTVDSVVVILQHQTSVLTRFPEHHGKIMKSLKCVVHVLHALSSSTTLGEGIGLAFPSAKPIFAAFGILLAAIKNVTSSYDVLINLMETIEHFLGRLDIYIGIPLTGDMGKILVKIMVELLSTIALVTSNIRQSRPLKLVMKILGENDVESVLQRLDRLTLDEARTTATQTLDVVHGLVQNIRVVMNDGKASSGALWDSLEIMQEILDKMNQARHKDLQREARKWISPPDPWKNHITARESHYKGTSTWFIEGNTFAAWKLSSPDLLLWIHGKPGAGKSVICSTIIEDVFDMRKRGLATLAFFYCDFRDVNKKNLRGLLSSILLQLCDHSDSYSAILSDFYSAHGDGSREPSDDELVGCLEDILSHPGQAPVYIIIDGLDECPDTFGMPSLREKVLMFLKRLVNLHLQNLHLCITSRPEVDIQTTIDRLHFRTVSLHEESGQRRDIVNYIRSIVYTDAKMERWRSEDKELVIDVLTNKADGMFRWVYCQLEFLRRSLPSRIRQALDELPKSLDGTYERTLQDINEANCEFAHRIFQCVAVASRPLRVKELAEFLAFDFNAGEIPTFRPGWRPVDPLDALLTTCSSLLAVIKVEDSEVIQFSHFSVKEFLTSTRLTEAKDPIPRYYVSMTPAHTLVAQGCLGTLLHLNEDITDDGLKDFHLAKYAAEHWADHTRFETVSVEVQDGLKRLFDPRTQHLAVLVRIFDPRPSRSRRQQSTHRSQLRGSSLHYAACFGIHELIRFLVVECSQDVNGQDDETWTPLHLACQGGHVAFSRVLVEHGAQMTVGDKYKWTPLHLALKGGHVDSARVLVDLGADVNARNKYKSTPLHLVLKSGHVEFAEVLIEHGADVNAQDDSNSTPLHLAWRGGHVGFAQVLVEHGADVNARDNDKATLLHLALKDGNVEFAQILVGRGADVNARDKSNSAPLHLASRGGHVEFAQVLIDHGADVNSQDKFKMTPLYLASRGGYVEFAQVLIKHGADVDAKDASNSTPLHLAWRGRHVGFAQALVEHGADVNARDSNKATLLHLALKGGNIEFAQVLVEHGADVNARDSNKATLLHLALKGGNIEFAQVLVEHGADVNARDSNKATLLHLALKGGNIEFAKVLVEHGADVNAQDNVKRTPLRLASNGGHAEFTQILIEHGANVNTKDNVWMTPLHLASRGGHVQVAQVLIEHGADVNARDRSQSAPLHLASRGGHVDFAQVLIGHGANVNSRDNFKMTPLHLASRGGYVEFAQVLIEHGADVNAKNGSKSTSLDLALRGGHVGIASLLVEHGTDVHG